MDEADQSRAQLELQLGRDLTGGRVGGRALGLVGGSILVGACAPRVPATIEIQEPEPTAREDEDGGEGSQPRPKNYGPPMVVRAELSGPTVLRLHFSEPLAPLEGFDPQDFRISLGSRYVNTRSYGYGAYKYGGANKNYGAVGYMFAYYYDVGYQFHGQTQQITGFKLDEQQLDLFLAVAIDSEFCRGLEYDTRYSPPGVHYDNGLFLHYASGSIPIRDEDGAAMPNFGAAWVQAGRAEPPTNRRELTGEDAKRALEGLVPIACGPELPPGPR